MCFSSPLVLGKGFFLLMILKGQSEGFVGVFAHRSHKSAFNALTVI